MKRLAYLLALLVLLPTLALAQKPPINGVAGPTTSAELRSIITDESGSGALVFQGGALGAATGTSLSVTGNILSYSGTAIPAGGTTGSGYTFSSTSNFGLFFGSGVPTLSAAQGSLYLRSDGQPYYNTNGSTGWSTLGSGSGTVTSVSVVTANGLAGSVATATTTPAITLSTSVNGIAKGNGSAFSTASAGTDYVAPGAITTSGLTMTTARLLGRTTVSTGAVEEITVGAGLSLSGGSLTATGSAASITVGSTTVASGTSGRVLYDNGGTLGEYPVTGSTNVVMSSSPTLSGTIGGTLTFSGALTLSSALTYGGVTLSNSVTGTGSMALSASPTFTGTLAAANITNAGTFVQTSNSATAFVSGPNGGTNPVFTLTNNTASQAAGLRVTGAATGGNVAIDVTDSGSNANLRVDAKGSGTITLGAVSTGAITLTRATTMSAALTYGGVTLSNSVTGTGSMVLATAPTLTNPVVGTQTAGDNSTKAASTAYVASAISVATDIIDVRDYGASTGASRATNTTAFNNAFAAAKSANKRLYVPGGTFQLNQLAWDITSVATSGFHMSCAGAYATILDMGTAASPQFLVYGTNGAAGLFYSSFSDCNWTGTIAGVVAQFGSDDLASDYSNSFNFERLTFNNGSTNAAAVAVKFNNHFQAAIRSIVANGGGSAGGTAIYYNQVQFSNIFSAGGNASNIHYLNNFAYGNVFAACDAEEGVTGWTFAHAGVTDNVLVAGTVANLTYGYNGTAGARNWIQSPAVGTLATGLLNGSTGIVVTRPSGTTGTNTGNLVFDTSPTLSAPAVTNGTGNQWDMTTGYLVGGVLRLSETGNFTQLHDDSGTGKILIGNATASNVTQYRATVHDFLDSTGGTQWVQIASGGINPVGSRTSGLSGSRWATVYGVDANFTGVLSTSAPVTKTADFTLAAGEGSIINNRAATNTVTLPAASSFSGRWLCMKTIQAQTVVSNASNVVPLTDTAAGTAMLPATDGAWGCWQSDGTNWVQMMGSQV